MAKGHSKMKLILLQIDIFNGLKSTWMIKDKVAPFCGHKHPVKTSSSLLNKVLKESPNLLHLVTWRPTTGTLWFLQQKLENGLCSWASRANMWIHIKKCYTYSETSWYALFKNAKKCWNTWNLSFWTYYMKIGEIGHSVAPYKGLY